MNYPNGIKKKITKIIDYKNRGMSLENYINDSNTYYLEKDIAVIHKKPTPIQVVNVEYPAKNKTKITEAFFKKPSTTDYNGIYKGKYIDFEAKETKSKTSFCLNNIHDHQLEHLKKVMEHGGIAFLIIEFIALNEIYLLLGIDLFNILENSHSKSISIETIRVKGHILKYGYCPRLDYLKIVDQIMEVSHEKNMEKNKNISIKNG